jgi:hypothetical protein
MHVTFEASVHPPVVAMKAMKATTMMTTMTAEIGNARVSFRSLYEEIGQVRPQPDRG